MKSYEGVIIFPPESTPEVRKNQLQGLDDLIRKHSGSVTQKLEWGKRLLGYPLKKHREGYILVVDFQMDPKNTVEFRKNLELQDDILHYMITIKLEKLQRQIEPKEPKTTKPAEPAKTPTRTPSSGSHVSSHS